MENGRTFFGSNPGERFVTFKKLRNNRPAPIRTTSARAISATTSMDRTLLPRNPDDEPRAHSTRHGVRSVPRSLATGASPNKSPEQREQTTVKSKVTKSM